MEHLANPKLTRFRLEGVKAGESEYYLPSSGEHIDLAKIDDDTAARLFATGAYPQIVPIEVVSEVVTESKPVKNVTK